MERLELAFLGIFALMAIALRSYSQPNIILSVIPFGFVGALIGHLLLGYDMSLPSALGMLALAGVVVNDSLVLVSAIDPMALSLGFGVLFVTMVTLVWVPALYLVLAGAESRWTGRKGGKARCEVQ